MKERISVGIPIGTSPPIGRINALVRAARIARFDVVWAIDHFQSFFPRAMWDEDFAWMAKPGTSPHEVFEYQVLLGHLAKTAGSMQVGIGVTEPIRRHPVLIAQAFLTLSHLTKRPPILGIGSGEAENTIPYGFSFERPVSRLEEALQIIRACFTSDGAVNFEGEFHHLDGALMDLRPVRDRTPEIWVAAHGPRMLRLAGTYGDGWLPVVPMTPDEYQDRHSAIKEAARGAGRDPSAIVPGFSARIVLGRNEAEARRNLGHKSVRFLALLVPDYVWQKHGLTHPLGEGHGGLVDFSPEDHEVQELEAMMAAIPLDYLAVGTLWGTPDQAFEQLMEFVDAGARHIVLQPVSGLVSKRSAVAAIRASVGMARKLRRLEV